MEIIGKILLWLLSVLWIRKYFFRIQIREPKNKLRIRPDPNPTWIFLWPLKKIRCLRVLTNIKEPDPGGQLFTNSPYPVSYYLSKIHRQHIFFNGLTELRKATFRTWVGTLFVFVSVGMYMGRPTDSRYGSSRQGRKSPQHSSKITKYLS